MNDMTNPLLARIKFPGETFQLPSRGRLYHNSELAETVEDGEVRVYPMTTIDELQMKSPDMLYSGEAIREVFSRCVPDVLNAGQLFAKDIDFLLICLRKVSYGDDLEINYNHHCQKDEEEKDISVSKSYIVNITPMIQNAVGLDPLATFEVTLPNEQKVTLNPIRFDDYIRLSQKSAEGREKKITPQELKDNIMEIAASIIADVDGVTEKPFILQWLNALKPKWITMINKAIEKTADWGPEYAVGLKCSECGKKITINIPLNPLYFFT